MQHSTMNDPAKNDIHSYIPTLRTLLLILRMYELGQQCVYIHMASVVLAAVPVK